MLYPTILLAVAVVGGGLLFYRWWRGQRLANELARKLALGDSNQAATTSIVEDRFRVIFDNTRDIISCTSLRGITLDVNQAVHLLGYTPEDMIGKHFTRIKLLRMADIPRVVRQFGEAVVAGAPRPIVELELRHKDGTLIPFEISTRFVKRNGRVVEVVNVFRDLSERKAAMAELAAAKNAAEEANRSKSEFLAAMSHEIRTPLTSILGFAELILEGPPTEEIIEAAQVIKRSGEHVLNVINDILDLARIEQGRVRLDFADCPVRHTVDDVLLPLRRAAEEKGLVLGVEIEDGMPDHVRSDPIRLRQILTNLVGNAIKFTAQGSVRIRVHRLADGSESGTCFDVIDTGVGLSAEQIGRLFQPFVQVGSAHVQQSGTGLGLAISSRLAATLGGEISVVSQPGQGSTFTLTLGARPTNGS